MSQHLQNLGHRIMSVIFFQLVYTAQNHCVFTAVVLRFTTFSKIAHHPTTAVVVQVHQGASVFHHLLPSVYERLGKLYAVVDVVAASAPVERAPGVAVPATLVAVAVTDL